MASALGVLLDGVEVLDSDAVAAAMRSGAPLAPVIVTPRGGIVRHGRVVVAGRRGRGHGLVALRSELEALRLDGAGLEERTATAEAEVQRVAAEHQTIRTTIKELRDEVQASERATLALDHEVGGLKRQLERIAEERDRLVQRAADASARLEQLAVEREQVQTALAELDAQLEETRATRESTHEERSRRRVQSDEAARGLEALRVDLVTTEQRIQGLTSSERHLADRHDKAVQSIARFRADLTDFAGDRERSKESLATERARVEELGTELASRRGEIGGHEEEVAEVRGRHEELVSALRAVETELEAVGEALHGADMRLNEVRVNQENLVQRIRNELELELAEMHEEYAPADVDWDAVEAELTEAREKIGRLGNVNLAAIDDLTEVEERLEFLVAQRNDLQHSKQQLSRVLNDIEAESTRLFLETFKAVREHFQVLFRKLFGGGKADISLVDETNVLESGIEITARPPGKEMRSIIQLSGGERTLTAVALLFAIIRAHPCPCCLMDEVDAALDEDNTERFCLMLDEFLSRTQFILITHSRRTMARADVLFGVTMGERGVSRRVGVRFEDVREDGSIREGADAERPNDADRGEARVRKTPKEPGQNGNGNGNGNGASGKTAPPSVQGEVFAEIAAAAEGDGGGQTTGESTHRGRERGADVELEESAGGAD